MLTGSPSSRRENYINSQIDVNRLLPIDVFRPGVSPYGVPTRKDPLSEGLRVEIVQLMKHHNNMPQIELARRAGEDQQRVHKFVKGQMPYPPLAFLDRLFRVFGLTLVDGLRGHVAPVTQLPILRPDVQAIADDCAGLEEQGVQAVAYFVSTLKGTKPRGRSTATTASARERSTPARGGSRGPRRA